MSNPTDTRKVLRSLTCVTDDEVCHLILLAPCKSSDLDPIPTSLVKDCIDILVTPIASTINLSLPEGFFPSYSKSLPLSPLYWKKPTLHKDNMKNYWSASNCSFLSQVLNRVVASQLNSHTNSSNKSNQYQCAYRKSHSTETALLKIHNDILSSMDDGEVTPLTSLTLSTAFDTIDHTILLRLWLNDWFWVIGKALGWFKLYLTGRCQRIRLGDCLSSRADLPFGVPRGSIFGPLLFTLYTNSLSSMISGHPIPHHLYADDSQPYVSFASCDSAAALNGLQSCLASVQS